MMEDITKKFDDELEAELTRINSELTGEERERALRNFAEVYAKRVSGESLEIQKEEVILKEKNEKKNRWLNVAKDLGLKTLEIGSTAFLVLLCLNYEEEGTFSQTTTKNLVSKIFRK